MQDYGPQTPAGQAIFAQKYAQPNETYRDAANRLAYGLSETPDDYHAIRQVLNQMRFLPAGRIWAGVGTAKNTCAHNCFVSGTIADSYVDEPGSIMDRAKEAAATMRMGGGIGYDFSTLRPRGALVKKLMSNATGPVSFMEIFNAVGLNTSSSGHRRGAQMGILRVDHPDILEFVSAKQNNESLRGFNISVALTDKFMDAVQAGSPFDLVFGGEVYGVVQARDLWEKIMRSAWDWAEPGVVFIDRINQQNNLAYCETIAATNPCSEQPLPPYGACLLGSFNLPKYLKVEPGRPSPALRSVGYCFDFTTFIQDVHVVVRAMDRVNDVARYPLAEQMEEALSKRRMGLGVMGLANAIEALGHPYASPAFLDMTHAILSRLKNEAYRASALLARDKGHFRLFDPLAYAAAPFIADLDTDVQDLIQQHGLRNSHLISFAPTGTISQMADNVSGGIEPTFMREYVRPVIFPDGTRDLTVQDYGVASLNIAPRCSDELTAKEHIDVLVACQEHSDSAVSKTCNVSAAISWDDFQEIYFDAYRRGAKGCSVFNKDGMRFGLLRPVEEPVAEAYDAGCASGVCGL